jgi:hypothetical protein
MFLPTELYSQDQRSQYSNLVNVYLSINNLKEGFLNLKPIFFKGY